jgi:hypothetical protein
MKHKSAIYGFMNYESVKHAHFRILIDSTCCIRFLRLAGMSKRVARAEM